MKTKEELQQIAPLIESNIRDCLGELLQSEPCDVEWQVLDSLDFVVSVERPYSVTEKALMQKELRTAHDIGRTINDIVKSELFFTLTQKASLPVADIFLMQAVETANKFSFFIMTDRETKMLWHSGSRILIKGTEEGLSAFVS